MLGGCWEVCVGDVGVSVFGGRGCWGASQDAVWCGSRGAPEDECARGREEGLQWGLLGGGFCVLSERL